MVASTPQRFKFLDGLRGIAALSVVVFHNCELFKIHAPLSFPSWIMEVIAKGHLGVVLFFVLSGFVIAYSVRQSLISFSYCKYFFLKRSIRLDPPYWFALILMIVATLSFNQFFAKQPVISHFTIPQVTTNFLYLQGFFGWSSINPVAWTLCAEFQLYLFFIFALALVFRAQNISSLQEQIQFANSNTFALFFGLLLCFSLEQNQNLILPSFLVSRFEGWAAPFWYLFFLGSATCWTIIGWLQKKWLFFYYGIVLTYWINEATLHMGIALALAILIYLLAQRHYLVEWTLSSFFQYLGKISYSLYLTHWLVSSNFINFTIKRMGELHFSKTLFIILGGISLAILAAHFFYQWVEEPCLKLSQRMRWLSATSRDYI